MEELTGPLTVTSQKTSKFCSLSICCFIPLFLVTYFVSFCNFHAQDHFFSYNLFTATRKEFCLAKALCILPHRPVMLNKKKKQKVH